MEIVIARGHPNIRATHKTTLEVTKEKELSPRGDCIIGICADTVSYTHLTLPTN